MLYYYKFKAVYDDAAEWEIIQLRVGSILPAVPDRTTDYQKVVSWEFGVIFGFSIDIDYQGFMTLADTSLREKNGQWSELVPYFNRHRVASDPVSGQQL